MRTTSPDHEATKRRGERVRDTLRSLGLLLLWVVVPLLVYDACGFAAGGQALRHIATSLAQPIPGVRRVVEELCLSRHGSILPLMVVDPRTGTFLLAQVVGIGIVCTLILARARVVSLSAQTPPRSAGIAGRLIVLLLALAAAGSARWQTDVAVTPPIERIRAGLAQIWPVERLTEGGSRYHQGVMFAPDGNTFWLGLGAYADGGWLLGARDWMAAVPHRADGTLRRGTGPHRPDDRPLPR